MESMRTSLTGTNRRRSRLLAMGRWGEWESGRKNSRTLPNEHRASNIEYRKRGFTLIELMVVLAILVIISGVAVISIGPALRDAKVRSACRIVASTINYARSRAVTTNSAVRVVFDSASVGVCVPVEDSSVNEWRMLTTSAGKRHSLPEGVEIAGVAKTASVENGEWIEFSGSGEADGASIEVSDAAGTSKFVIVDSITGRCRVEATEGP